MPRSFQRYATGATLAMSALIVPLAISASDVPPPENLAQMFQVPGLPADVKQIKWSALPQLKGTTVEVFHGEENITAYNHHQNIAYFEDRFFVMWNTGYRDEDGSGQKVVYATSRDGVTWSRPMDLTGRLNGRRYTCVGLWIRQKELYAVAALRDSADEAGRGRQSDTDPLLAFRWSSDTTSFTTPVVLALNFFSNNIPQATPDGVWLMLGKGTGIENGVMRAARGGTEDLGQWTIADMPTGMKMEEAEWYVLPDAHLVAHYRSFTNPTPEGGRLIRLYSSDNGKTWTKPILTNFPEAGSRNHALRLSDGRYVLLVNPDPTGSRIPLSLALSEDGLVYTKLVNVRAESTKPRFTGKAKSAGYSYPRGLEQAGNLYIVYSTNKEDVDVTIVPLSELEQL